MLTKYQMIKFIDFCEVRFLPESEARVAVIVGDAAVQHRLSTVSPDSNPTTVVLQTGDDSLVKTTSFHTAALILLSSHHWRRRLLWFCIKCRPSNRSLTDRPLCCKRCRMVRADTE
ncbi:hypothetical protein TNCV_4420571 [Trichonephila clavipes]|nr:hypothetical protein TNCV_4420571 [Trichonephila clavipes]